MNYQRRQFLQIGVLSGACSVLGWSLFARTNNANDPDPEFYRTQMEKIRHLFTIKGKPQPGDWLASHAEAGQTFNQYRALNPNRPTVERTKLYLQAIGDFTEEQSKVIKVLQEFMGIVFGLPVEFLPSKKLSEIHASAQRLNGFTGQRQLLSTHILYQILKPSRPDDAVAVLAITNVDLWPGKNWNFVFGQASLSDRVGVWSTARMGDPVKEAGLFLRRVLQVAVHETGHMFGIKHCIAYECCMNGANHQGESDKAPLVFCVECEAKLWWACRMAPSAKAKALHEFAVKHKLSPDTEQWEKIAKALEAR